MENKTLSDEIKGKIAGIKLQIEIYLEQNFKGVHLTILQSQLTLLEDLNSKIEKHLQEFQEELKRVSEENDWEVAIDDGYEADGFRVIDGKEFIDTQMQKHFGKELI